MKIRITEEQLNRIIAESIQNEMMNGKLAKNIAKVAIPLSIMGSAIIGGNKNNYDKLSKKEKEEIVQKRLHQDYLERQAIEKAQKDELRKKKPYIDYLGREIPWVDDEEIGQNSWYNEEWNLAADDVIATVYNAVPAQCNNDPSHTASMFKLNMKDVASYKIIAMERSFMKELGVHYGDVVKIEGTKGYDGVYQVQDTMNKRFKGMHKIDILVDNNVKYGKWDNVRLYTLNDKELADNYKKDMAGQHKAMN